MKELEEKDKRKQEKEQERKDKYKKKLEKEQEIKEKRAFKKPPTMGKRPTKSAEEGEMLFKPFLIPFCSFNGGMHNIVINTTFFNRCGPPSSLKKNCASL